MTKRTTILQTDCSSFVCWDNYVPTQVVTLTQVVTSDYLGPTQVITTVPAEPNGNFLHQIKYTIKLYHATVLK